MGKLITRRADASSEGNPRQRTADMKKRKHPHPYPPAPPLVDSTEYCGNYVAMKSLDDRTVIAWGPDYNTTLNQAKQRGVDNPLIELIPSEDDAFAY